MPQRRQAALVLSLMTACIVMTFGERAHPQVPIGSEWTVLLTFTPSDPNSSVFNLSFGTRVGATAGYDPGLDEVTPPPGFLYYVHFSAPPPTNFLRKDFRGSQSASEQWIAVLSNTIANNISTTITWDASQFPEGDTPGALTINGQNMLTTGSLQINPFTTAVVIQYTSPLINPPAANFVASPLNGPPPLSITFSDATTNTSFIESWAWSFPGGTPASATGPGPHTVVYGAVGCYDVSLTVCNGAGCDTETKMGYVCAGLPDIAVNPTSLSFGHVAAGSSKTLALIIQNDPAATADLVVSAITPPSGTGFSVSGVPPLPLTLPPGVAQQVDVTFSPGEVGSQNGNLVIESTDPDESPLAVPLAGVALSWLVPMSVQALGNATGILPEVSDFNLEMGGHPDATDGFDQGLDVVIAPPGFNYYAYFSIAPPVSFLGADIRGWAAPFDTDIDWHLVISNAIGITSAVAWDPAQLPAQGSFILKGAGPDINMRAQNSAQVTGNAVLIIEYRLEVCVVYDFSIAGGGWYLISLPVIPEDNRVSVLFPGAVIAYGWNYASQFYQQVNTLEPGKAYWLLMLQVASVEVCGLRFESYTHDYTTPGWDLTGSVIQASALVDNPDNSVLSMFGWNPVSGQYFGVTPMVAEPKQGYWILVLNAPSSVTVGGTGAAGLSGAAPSPDLAAFYRIYGMTPPPPPFSVSSDQSAVIRPADYGLSQNYPNPFNPETVIEYQLPEAGRVSVKIFDILGHEVRTLIDQNMPAGFHRMQWDGRGESGQKLESGVYLYRLRAAEFTATRKLVLLK